MIVPVGAQGLTFEDVERIIAQEQGRALTPNMSYEPVKQLVKCVYIETCVP